MTPEIRPIRDDELTAFVDAVSTGFLERPDVAKIVDWVRPVWDLQRVWAALEDGRICGTFRSWGTHLTAPGGVQLPAAAVAGVTVMPTHRRRGILRAMIAAEHRAARERGEAVAILYASEYGIYGRLGYGPACRAATWTLTTASTAFQHPPDGRVELVTPDAEASQAMKQVFEAARASRVGEIRRRDFNWKLDLGLLPSAWGPDWKGFLAVHRGDDGAVDGYVRYRAEEKWEQRQPRNILDVDDLHATTEAAYDALWGFLGSMDWVATVRAERRSIAERLPWILTNARAAVPSDVGDALWVRLLDVRFALEARRYERDARIVLEVVDGELASGRVRLELDAASGHATVRETAKAADLTVDVSALGAAYLGGTSLRDAVIARGFDEHRPGALAEADALLRTLDEPWCSTFF